MISEYDLHSITSKFLPASRRNRISTKSENPTGSKSESEGIPNKAGSVLRKSSRMHDIGDDHSPARFLRAGRNGTLFDFPALITRLFDETRPTAEKALAPDEEIMLVISVVYM